MLGLSTLAGTARGAVLTTNITDVEVSAIATESLDAIVAVDIQDTVVASFNEVPDTDISQVIFAAVTVTEERFSDIQDGATIGEALFSTRSADLFDGAVATDAVDRVTDGVANISETLLGIDQVFTGFVVGVAVSGSLSSSADTVLLSPVEVRDRARLVETLSSQLIPGNLLVELVAPTENWFSVVQKAATTGDIFAAMTIEETIPVLAQTYNLVSSAASLSSTHIANQVINDVWGDIAGVTDARTAGQILQVLLRSRAHVTSQLLEDPRFFEAWVINAETGAPSRYLNLPFNSATWFEALGLFVMAKEDGLFVLDPKAPDDEGIPIRARVRTGLSDLGTSRKKRIHSVNFGLTADGPLVLKMIVSEGGQKDEHWYQFDPVLANAPTEAVVPVGEGLSPRYWGLELENVEGSYFEIDAAELYPVPLGQRKVS